MASKLLATAKIRLRIDELATIMKETANAEFAMSAEELINRLTLIARGNLRDYVEIDGDGQPTITLRGATERQIYALNEVSVEDIEAGRRRGKRTKVKLADRIAALKLLGSHHGLFRTDVRLNGGQPIPVVLSSAEAAL